MKAFEGGRRPGRRKRKASARTIWKRIQWAAFTAAAVAGTWVIVTARQRPEEHRLAYVTGIGLLVLGGVMLFVAWQVEDTLNRQGSEEAMQKAAGYAHAGGLAGAIAAFALAISHRWPQPLLVLVLGMATALIGLNAKSVAPPPDRGRFAAARGPAGSPADPPKKEEPPPPAYEPPKTPPPASDFAGLIAYWSLDEGRGTAAFDPPGRREATLHGGKWVPGIRGQALEFNGTSEYLDLGQAPQLNVPEKFPFTFACWVKPETKSGTVFWFHGGPRGLPFVGVQIVDGKFRAWIRKDGGVHHPNFFKGELVGAPLRLGEWHHVTLTRNAEGVVELFQDGRFSGRTQGRDTGGKITTDRRALGVELHLMLTDPKSPDVRFLQGCVDEFCIFDRTLSAEDIAKLAGRDP